MPSERRYFGIRLPAEEEKAVDGLLSALHRQTGVDVGYTDLFRRGLRSLAGELGVSWPDMPAPREPEPPKPKRPRGRPRKKGGGS